MKRSLVLTVTVLFLYGCSSQQGQPVSVSSTSPGKPATGEINFKTADGWTIYGDFRPANRATKGVILLHMRMGQAADWAPLVEKLNAAGIATLAIDQRGAGRSMGRENGQDAPWDTTGDIQGAVDWLAARGVKSVGLAGASYGANNALIYAAAHPAIRAVALLSLGTDYHGLKIEPAAGAYKGALMILSAKGDPIMEGGPETVTRTRGDVESKVYEGDAHGTKLFSSQPDSADAITVFFKAHL